METKKYMSNEGGFMVMNIQVGDIRTGKQPEVLGICVSSAKIK
jgi:hypothetical protein